MTILQLGQVSHILAFTDISSALGWMHKASFDPLDSESQNSVSRWIGWTLVSNETYLYSQHIKGIEKIIADYLSQYFHMSDQTLTNKFNRILSPQTAASFYIKQTPRNVISRISFLASSSTHPTASTKLFQPRILSTGVGGANSSNIQASQTNSWEVFHKIIGQYSCHHSPLQCDETSLAQPGKNSLPGNYQVRHIGCICILPGAP